MYTRNGQMCFHDGAGCFTPCVLQVASLALDAVTAR